MTVDLTFDEYQEMAGTTAIYPESGSGSVLALAYVGLGLGESGEVQNQIKKALRDDNGAITPKRKANIIKEISDLLWYCARIATELDCTLGDIAQGNLDKLADRKDRGVLQGSGDNR